MPFDALVNMRFPSDTGLAKDTVNNSWAVTGQGDFPEGADAILLLQYFQAFYTNTQVGGDSLAEFMSPTLDTNVEATDSRLYNITGKLDGSDHGSPVYTDRGQLTGIPVGAIPYPSEVAFCITLESLGWDEVPVNVPAGAPGPAGDFRPKQRRSGRIFLGPLNTNAGATVNGVVRPSTQLRACARAAVVQLMANVALIEPTIRVSVWSRKDAVNLPLISMSVDNAFDIQRRRGEAPTVRERTVLV